MPVPANGFGPFWQTVQPRASGVAALEQIYQTPTAGKCANYGGCVTGEAGFGQADAALLLFSRVQLAHGPDYSPRVCVNIVRTLHRNHTMMRVGGVVRWRTATDGPDTRHGRMSHLWRAL